jgi:hypothetical protein
MCIQITQKLVWKGKLVDLFMTGRIIFKTELKEVRCDIMDWILVAQDRDRLWTFVSMVVKLEVLCKVEFLEYVSDC